ncbi:putative ABC-type ATPase [Roseimicrobium gellanilyticum]|uniref:Putative ABC-type ATPase n=1 Tax=Roseimicrobium gellanilyticum TaxID=748857 RepID=A0A366HWJ1_9BACT|nr:AAA family ATPase [Roseimicrobium gellanilyticum]RBP48069.1 putative ABC-type ATPase [Roseimicrobium gellanilyticum]
MRIPDESPTLLLIGGCNGTGKTTFARRLLPAEGIERFLNADELARGLSPLKPELTALRAGRLLLEEARRLIDARSSFGLESTLSGKTYARLLEEAKTAGFVIMLHFLVVPSPEVAIERVAQRVQKGGHHVPDADIRRRFRRSVENFLHTYVSLADAWKVWDNELNTFTPIADSENHSYDEVSDLLTRMTLKEDKPRIVTPSTERAMRAMQLAYEDAKAENARWGLPMIPQEWDPRIEPVYTGKKKATSTNTT